MATAAIFDLYKQVASQFFRRSPTEELHSTGKQTDHRGEFFVVGEGGSPGCPQRNRLMIYPEGIKGCGGDGVPFVDPVNPENRL